MFCELRVNLSMLTLGCFPEDDPLWSKYAANASFDHCHELLQKTPALAPRVWKYLLCVSSFLHALSLTAGATPETQQSFAPPDETSSRTGHAAPSTTPQAMARCTIGGLTPLPRIAARQFRED